MSHSASVAQMWAEYLQTLGETPSTSSRKCVTCQFSDNRAEVDELAALVLAGRKRATASSVWELEAMQEPMPAVGDLQVVTDWSGTAVGVIRTSKVEIVPYRDVSEAFAAREGEGDGSLTYWRRVHWAYYTRVLEPFGRIPTEDMKIVCEQFELVFPLYSVSAVDCG